MGVIGLARKGSYYISNFKCNICDMSFPLPRKTRRMRELGHIKDLYCPRCKEITKFRELREYETLLVEE